MIKSGEQYYCVAGETFDSVALTVYGNERYAAELLNANPGLCSIMIFTGGELLELPVVPIVAQEEDEFMPATAPWKE